MIDVRSETGKLEKVLLHRPGGELEHLTPDSLERLLFDDIPYLRQTVNEHDAFASVLRESGCEVVYLEDLVVETISQSEELRRLFVKDFIDRSESSLAVAWRYELEKFLLDIESPMEPVLSTMRGVRDIELEYTGRSLQKLVSDHCRFILEPVPNLYFTRDPFASISDGVSINHMYSATRRRETIYSDFIFRYHPEYCSVKKYYERDWPFSIEGGDIMNLTDKVIMIGLSERTCPEAVQLLSERLIEDESCSVEKVIAADIPNMRAYMHLDTVFTQLDENMFVVHPGIIPYLRLFEITHNGIRELDGTLRDVLCSVLNRDDIRLISCGGNDQIASSREQWNDASNTLCIEPGKVIVYDRNTVTNSILRDVGIETVEICSSELSRGRGGPRCMSMPLVRQST